MDTMINLCFLCEKDYKCISVDDKIVSQVEYLFPEITIFKLNIPLRICSVCDGAIYAFNKFKEFYIESSRRLETRIKGAQGPSIHPDSTPVVDDNESYTNCEIIDDSSSCSSSEEEEEEEHLEETPLETQIHTINVNPIVLLERINIEPSNQLHKDRVSQKMQLHTDTNIENIDDIIIIENELVSTPEEQEFYKNLLNEESLNIVTEQNTQNNMTLDTKSPIDFEQEIDKNNKNIPKNQQSDQDLQKMKEKCNICGILLANKVHLRHHLKSHNQTKNSNGKKYKCSVCNRSYSSSTNLKRHEKDHSENSFGCDICKLMFTTATSLRSHIINHHAKFNCSICNKLFNTEYDVKNHMKSHTGTNNFQCPTCGRSFNLKCNLLRHIRSHSGIKNFKCKICGKSFMQKSNLLNHLKTHSGAKEFKCDFCNKSFSQKPGLMNHEKIHYGVKDHHCHICDKSFLHKYHLDRHMEIHIDIKAVNCVTCKKLYAFRADNKLMEKIMGRDGFQCDICWDKICAKKLKFFKLK